MKIFNPNIAPPIQMRVDEPTRAVKADDKSFEMDRLKKACRNFEAIFISYLLKNMRKTTGDSELFGSGLGGDIYQEIFDEKLAEGMSASGQLKIGDILFDRYSSLVNGAKKVIKNSTDLPDHKPVALKSPAPDATGAAIQRAPSSKSPSVIPDKKSDSPFEHIIRQAAEKFGLSPELINAVIRHESAGDPKAVSSKGAKGLMQLMDSTAKSLGVSDPFDPLENIMGGARYLASLIKQFGGDISRAVASYNAGPGVVEKYGGIPPFPETQNYVRNVLSSLRED